MTPLVCCLLAAENNNSQRFPSAFTIGSLILALIRWFVSSFESEQTGTGRTRCLETQRAGSTGAAGQCWVLPHPKWLCPGSRAQAPLPQHLQLPHVQPGIWVAFLSTQVLGKTGSSSCLSMQWRLAGPERRAATSVPAATHVALSPSRTPVEPWVSCGPPCPQVLSLPSAGQGRDSHPGLLASHCSFSYPWHQVCPAVQVETPGSLSPAHVQV